MTNEMTKRLSGKEVLRRDKLVAEITSKLKDFMTCAVYFREIRESRLYRDTHSSFVSFCDDHWDLSRTYVDRLISASKVAEGMTQPPDVPRQLTELAQVKAKDRDTVMNEARDTAKAENREVTAKDVRKAGVAVREKAKVTGKVGPKAALACRPLFNGLSQSLGAMLTKFDEVARSEGGAWLRDRGTILVRQRFEAAIKDAQAIVQSGKPVAACPHCDGEGVFAKKLCSYCDGSGYITKQQEM